MKKLHFTAEIRAPKEKVWDALWKEANYRAWTSAFAEGSYAKTDNWKEGTNVLFLDPKGDGMVSLVARNKPNEYMSFKHLGEVRQGVEDTNSERVQAWSGAMENYTLTEEDGKTILTVEMDSTDEFTDYFSKTWPQKLKDLAEIN